MDAPGGHGMLGQKVGPLPLVVWVGLAGGAVAIALAVRSKMKNTSSSGGVAGAGIDMLSPSTAEAFGTLQQQQSDLTNALSALGADVSNVGTQVSGVSGQVSGVNANTAGLQAQNYATLTALTAGANDPRVTAWQQLAQNEFFTAAGQTAPNPTAPSANTLATG